ncbi:MAG: carbohydrate ABC transporter permease [Spirochaetes bacterium]|uniref:Carbohydrate ABC transporter permease n=1 Tax=Candidatus Ornithospirochaeta stercoripullorum TaxID=2840899 RepID=A0A9D9E0L3_9SPIO|nr:carbohydrate ABC transporter permease [Candidatus Ornithospirochaeta stercoripullorum]
MTKDKGFKIAGRVVLHIFLLIAVFISIFPFFWMLTGATNESIDITSGRMWFGSNLSENWANLRDTASVLRIAWNTISTTVIYTVLSVLICAMAGYGFEKFPSKGKTIVYGAFLFSMMIPFSAQMIPLFRMASSVNMLNSHIAIILPTIAMPFLVFFFRQNFQSYPTELIEAARVDGANEFVIFFRLVMMPMKSTFAAAAIYAFMKQWNNYLWPLIVIQTNEKKTFTLLLSSLASAYYVDYGQLMLAIVLATLPIIIVFLTMQRQFVEGITGSSK